ncbi:hypothetical protein [Paenibacillus pabuli]|uniref:hypothetical protein n=1 Tax=Paenibacillus pabuli TaxID=1472 RepID=UPI0007836D04|nr:hypothetical protein [Paenibacillus pabuli]MEC0128504.1 hypothetical protein [Paenibacillus pabuli]
MHCWRVTKYNPVYRDNEGNFKKEDWTSYYDIGKVYEGKEFTLSDYLSFESRYIDAIVTLMQCMNVSSFKITNVEKYDDNVTQNLSISSKMADLFATVKDGDTIDNSNLSDICKLILREHLWGKLSVSSMFVHFGNDYYMYIGLQEECVGNLNEIRNSGLFVETYTSPYQS